MSGIRYGGADACRFRTGTDGLSICHVCCGVIKSTNKPVSRVLEPNTNLGSVFISKVMPAMEFVTNPWWNNADLSCP